MNNGRRTPIDGVNGSKNSFPPKLRRSRSDNSSKQHQEYDEVCAQPCHFAEKCLHKRNEEQYQIDVEWR